MPRDRSTIRRILIRRLLEEREISSQAELASLLGEEGHRVTQSTVSRDLTELGAAELSRTTSKGRSLPGTSWC
jgi:arginine repressor